MRIGAALIVALHGVGAETAPVLQFVHSTIHVDAPVTATTVTVDFPFRNVAPRAVRITSITPSCSCLTAVADKQWYAAGESGCITLAFTVGEHTGAQSKWITVSTDPSNGGPLELIAEVSLPPGPELSTTIVAWEVGSASIAREVTLRLPKDPPYRILGIECRDARIAAALREGSEAGSHVLTLTPGTTGAAFTTDVRIITNFRDFHIFAAAYLPAR